MTRRLGRLLPDSMDEAQRRIHAKFVSGRRAHSSNAFSLAHEDGGLLGPPNAWLRSPPVAAALEQLGGALRYELQLEPRLRELAILLVGVHRDSAFELEMHVPAARAAGLTDAEIDTVLAGRRPQLAAADELVVHDAVKAMLQDRTLGDEQYADALRVLGERGLVELVTLIGYYDFVAMQLAVLGTAQDD